jgi:ribosome-binding protein aMBF1 (putative translation factor)
MTELEALPNDRDSLLDSLENILDKDDSIIMSQERPYKDLSQKDLAEKLAEWYHKFKDIRDIDDREEFKKLARELDDEYKPYFDEAEIRTRLEIKERKEKQNGTSKD